MLIIAFGAPLRCYPRQGHSYGRTFCARFSNPNWNLHLSVRGDFRRTLTLRTSRWFRVGVPVGRRATARHIVSARLLQRPRRPHTLPHGTVRRRPELCRWRGRDWPPVRCPYVVGPGENDAAYEVWYDIIGVLYPFLANHCNLWPTGQSKYVFWGEAHRYRGLRPLRGQTPPKA